MHVRITCSKDMYQFNKEFLQPNIKENLLFACTIQGPQPLICAILYPCLQHKFKLLRGESFFIDEQEQLQANNTVYKYIKKINK